MSCRLYGFHPGNMTRSCRSRRVAVSTTAVAMNAVVQPASSLLVRCHRDTAKSSDDTNRVAQQRNELLYNNILSLLLLSSFWTSCGLGCHPFPPPVRAFSFLMAHRAQHSHCSSTFIECCYNNSRSLAFRGSICAQEKVPTNLDEYALGGTRTHEIDL